MANEQAGLLSLPQELLDAILALLDRASLAHVARTSHHLYAGATPTLYRDVMLENRTGESFAAAIQRTPALGEYVQVLTVHHHSINTIYPPDIEFSNPCFEHLGQLQKITIKGCEYANFLTDETPVPNEIPEVQSLHLGLYTALSRTLLSPMSSQLHTCELNLTDHEQWDLCVWSTLFFHPSLRKLSVLGAMVSDHTVFKASLHRGPGLEYTTPLQELTLLCCDLSPFVLRDILSIPQALKRFTYKGSIRAPPEDFPRDHTLYFAALRQQKHSLQSLELGFRYSNWHYNAPFKAQHFSSLEELVIRPGILQGNQDNDLLRLKNNLPPSLRTLVVCGRNRRLAVHLKKTYITSLRGWVAEGALPNFRHLRFEDMNPSPLDSGEDRVGEGVMMDQRRTPPNERFPLDCPCCDYIP